MRLTTRPLHCHVQGERSTQNYRLIECLENDLQPSHKYPMLFPAFSLFMISVVGFIAVWRHCVVMGYMSSVHTAYSSDFVRALDEWYAPAYTEPMESILFLATEETSALPSRFTYPDTPTAVQAEMAKALRERVHVRVLVQPGSMQRYLFESALIRAGLSLPAQNISFLNISHCDIWARDTGPIWLRRARDGARKMVRPTFSLWGYLVGDHIHGPWASCDVPNRVPNQLSKALGIAIEEAEDFVTEGGDKSFNGYGTVLMSRAVERQRHPTLSDMQIEDLAKRYLHVRHVVWIDEGVVDDEQSFRGVFEGEGGRRVYTAIGTGGHVDECARFIGPRTVVLPQLTSGQAQRSPLATLTSARLERNAAQLGAQTDQDGQPLIIERMPYPEELSLSGVNASDGVFSLLAQLPELGLRQGQDINVM